MYVLGTYYVPGPDLGPQYTKTDKMFSTFKKLMSNSPEAFNKYNQIH